MSDSLKNLFNLKEHHVWYVAKGDIPHVASRPKGEKEKLTNLIDFVKTLRFANEQLHYTTQPLSRLEVKEISSSLLERSSQLQKTISQKSFFERLAIKICLWIFTRSNLSQATEELRKTVVHQHKVENAYIGKLRYPELIQDAEAALETQAMYEEIAKKYPVPKQPRYLSNPLLYHLRQEMCTHWREIRELIKKGKTLEDPEVMDLCDLTMQLGTLAEKLAIKRELEHVYQSRAANSLTKGYCFKDQTKYIWMMDITFANFYLWLRSIPSYEPSRLKGTKTLATGTVVKLDQEEAWRRNAFKQPELVQKFYQEGSRQNRWREQFNETRELIDEQLKQEILEADHRFYLDLDKGDISESVLLRFAHEDKNQLDDYIMKQLFLKHQ